MLANSGPGRNLYCRSPRLQVLLDDFRAGHVAGHQVGRELDPLEAQVGGLGQRADQQRLGQPRHAFQQRVAAGEDGDQAPARSPPAWPITTCDNWLRICSYEALHRATAARSSGDTFSAEGGVVAMVVDTLSVTRCSENNVVSGLRSPAAACAANWRGSRCGPRAAIARTRDPRSGDDRQPAPPLGAHAAWRLSPSGVRPCKLGCDDGGIVRAIFWALSGGAGFAAPGPGGGALAAVCCAPRICRSRAARLAAACSMACWIC